ncbi:MAG: RdgB/HAM1 family non-canonical purine NTP pyrophosphatase [Gammaproteobacteria bacterium]|nr:RdgB/HAM1 family non-canonical purine NTP pyrophosphatase [Gammaproteobacteria bacterium]
MEIVLASGNLGKLREFESNLDSCPLVIRPKSDFGIPDPEETGRTFRENALIKARAASRHCGLPALADDSGLAVDGLDGAPGVHSARYAGPGASDRQNIAKLLGRLEGMQSGMRSATFHCVIAMVQHGEDDCPALFFGSWAGRIATTPSGSHGFGYDPVFYLPEFDCTAAELGPEVKNAVSHRARALEQFREWIRKADFPSDILNPNNGEES